MINNWPFFCLVFRLNFVWFVCLASSTGQQFILSAIAGRCFFFHSSSSYSYFCMHWACEHFSRNDNGSITIYQQSINKKSSALILTTQLTVVAAHENCPLSWFGSNERTNARTHVHIKMTEQVQRLLRISTSFMIGFFFWLFNGCDWELFPVKEIFSRESAWT